MKTLVTGCSGLVGNALVEYLFKNGHSIQCLGRNSADHHAGFWLTESLRTDSDSNFNTVIHLAGENVARGRWTSKKKKLILNSRVDGTRELVDHISLMATKPNQRDTSFNLHGCKGRQSPFWHGAQSKGRGIAQNDSPFQGGSRWYRGTWGSVCELGEH
ncbi:MAG: NAD-dependent epimerase/dehydratase family protein [Deltaproteobacteria bacterium]|nr:NAD-dependent epimerase/dehydratase family protein [Deltaproteobacteria bacterium]